MQHAKRHWWLDAAGLASATPARGWGVVWFTLTRTLLTAGTIVALGKATDAILAGDDATGTVLLAGAGALVAAASAGFAAILPAAQQAVEEPRWRNPLAERLLASPLDHGEPAGQIVGQLGDDVERIASYRATFLGPFLAAMLVPVMTLLVIGVSVGWLAALILAVCIGAAPPLLGYFMSRFRASNGAHRRAAAALATEYLESIRALGTIALLGAGAQRRVRLARLTESVRQQIMQLLRRNQLVLLVTDGIFGLTVSVASGVLALALLAAGVLSPGTALALLLLARQLLEPVDQLGRSFYVGMAGRASADRVTAVLMETDDGGPPLTPVPPVPPGSSRRPAGIGVHGVTIRRGGREVVHGADGAMAPGTVSAIVGPSGAGKTTLALCLAGLLQETGGQITLDGAPAGASRRRALVAYVPQHTVLFTGTLASNLRLGATDATDAQLWEVLDLVGVGTELRAAGRGLDTALTGLGPALSGGQVQRVSIARALLSRKAVLVLDEPTANLDPDSAALVLDSLVAAAATTTVVFVTHRLEETDHAGAVIHVAPPARASPDSPDTPARPEHPTAARHHGATVPRQPHGMEGTS